MKKYYLYLLFISISFSCFSQVTIQDHHGDAITDGKVYQFAYLGQALGEVGIKITNNTTSTVHILAEVVNMENASGSNLQFCLADECYPSIAETNSYPINTTLTLNPGESNNDFDHFFNNYPGNDPNQAVEYEFRFYEVDNSGNEIGDLVTFSYVYDSTLSVKSNTLEGLGVNLFSSIPEETIQFNAKQPIQINMYNITGKRIFEGDFNTGNQEISASKLQSGIYILEFISKDGARAVKKIVKK